jgi:hypothetical protein
MTIEEEEGWETVDAQSFFFFEKFKKTFLLLLFLPNVKNKYLMKVNKNII